MIYQIKDIYLEVICDIKDFEELVYGRFSQFKKTNLNYSNNYLKISEKKIEINVKDNKKEMMGKIFKTDLYTIINNVISYIINDDNNLYIHSVVVSKRNKAILIIGDFGQGKTTLANEFLKYGFTINSTDQTWLEICGNKLIQRLGSRFYMENNNIRFIDNKNSMKNIRIDKIIRIVGLCDNGEFSMNTPKNMFYKVKQISNYASWSMISPLFTDNIELYNIKENIKSFLLKLDKIPLYNVRGDKKEIAKRYI